jgi:hypothetical protein
MPVPRAGPRPPAGVSLLRDTVEVPAHEDNVNIRDLQEGVSEGARKERSTLRELRRGIDC